MNGAVHAVYTSNCTVHAVQSIMQPCTAVEKQSCALQYVHALPIRARVYKRKRALYILYAKKYRDVYNQHKTNAI